MTSTTSTHRARLFLGRNLRHLRNLRIAFLALLLPAISACGASGPTVHVVTSTPADSFPNAADPALASDPATGDLLLAFVGGSDSTGWKLYFSRSSDGGAVWSRAVTVTGDPHEVHPHGEASPRLVAGPGGRIGLVWPQNIEVEGRKWPANRMRFARSLDGGNSWSPPVTINDDTTGTLIGHTFQGAAWVGDSGVVAAWLDERAGTPHQMPAGADPHQHDMTDESDATIYSVSSTDFGGTWGPNRPLWGAVCPCCRVTMARAADGGTLAAWRKHYPGNVRDIVVSEVKDSLGDPTRVREDNWVYPGCPHSGPSLSIDRGGAPHVAWFTGRPGGAGVYLTRGTGALAFEGQPLALLTGDHLQTAHPAVTAMDDGSSIVAWDVNQKGNRVLSVAHVDAGDAKAGTVEIEGSAGSTYPQLAPLKSGGAIMAWTQLVGEKQRLGLARIELRQ